jgi:hypothetical protein
MAPTWYGIRGKTAPPSHQGRKHTQDEEERFASSSSLNVDSVQFAGRQIPNGFEQFSPPLHQRRILSHQPRSERTYTQDTTKTAVNDVDAEKMEASIRSSEDESNHYSPEDHAEKHATGSGGKEREVSRRDMNHDRPHSASHHRRHLNESALIKTLRDDVAFAELCRLPHGGEEGKIYDRRRTIHTMITILGGWLALISACFGFKFLSVKYHVRAPDFLAVYVLNSPTATTQWCVR